MPYIYVLAVERLEEGELKRCVYEIYSIDPLPKTSRIEWGRAYASSYPGVITFPHAGNIAGDGVIEFDEVRITDYCSGWFGNGTADIAADGRILKRIKVKTVKMSLPDFRRWTSALAD